MRGRRRHSRADAGRREVAGADPLPAVRARVERVRSVAARWALRWRRSRLARRLLRRRALAALLACVVAWTVLAELRAAERTRMTWGPVVAVQVAARSLDAGARIAAEDTRTIRLPARAVPTGSVSAPPVGRRLLADVVAGEVLVSTRLAPRGTGATAATAGGTDAVTVPVGDAPAPVHDGDLVDVYAAPRWDPASFDPLAPQVATGAVERLASGVRVVRVRTDAVTLAVPRERVETLLESLATGAPMLVIVG
ncbi:MAG: SAF domain-containing protein [Microthrixaceae bacterium]